MARRAHEASEACTDAATTKIRLELRDDETGEPGGRVVGIRSERAERLEMVADQRSEELALRVARPIRGGGSGGNEHPGGAGKLRSWRLASRNLDSSGSSVRHPDGVRKLRRGRLGRACAVGDDVVL